MGRSAREHSSAGCEHSVGGLREVAEVNEACAGGEAGYSKSDDQGSSGDGAAVNEDDREVSAGYDVDAGNVEEVSVVGDSIS